MARELGISRSTCRGWLEGKTVPKPERAHEFMAVVEKLQHACGRPQYTDAEWESALCAAQQEARRAPGEHAPVDVQGRTRERTEMNSFVSDERAEAPAYLCWYADTPVGKTTLLVDYLRRRRPPRLDVLSFFVSPERGKNTRRAFEDEIARQARKLLEGAMSPSTPRGVAQWQRLFAKAADKSTCHGRRLLLVVDGLDDDVAWSGLAAETDGLTAQRAGSGAVHKLARGSIAALLPSPPPPGMRVIVSLRRRVRLPDDVPPVRHPLRQSRHFRPLMPVAGVPLTRQPPPDPAALGEPFAGLLAVADGGLRIADLAELTGLPMAHLDRLAQGPAGRALVTEDPVSRTYALATTRLVHAVRAELGEAGVLRRTHELSAWSRQWCAAGWPDGTPLYPLAHQLRLLTDTTERAAYVLDLPRLRRLARTAGPPAAFAQLDAFAGEISETASDTTADALATLVPLFAARTLLRQEAREVPDGAASLSARLGDVERACALARSAPTAVTTAVHLADVAVEMAYASVAYEGWVDPDTLVREAVEWLARDRTDQAFPGPYRDPEPHARLLGAARTLAAQYAPSAARALLHAVLQDPRSGTETLIEAAGMLDPLQDPDLVAVLRSRAEMLGEGNMRARAAAVDLWGALARAAPTLGPKLGNEIEAICAELGDADGLGASNVLATAASALVALPAGRSRSGPRLMREALVRMRSVIETLDAPDFLPDESDLDGPAHLNRELSGTLHRLAKAVHDAGLRQDRDDLEGLLNSLPERLRIGALGGSAVERAQQPEDARQHDARKPGRPSPHRRSAGLPLPADGQQPELLHLRLLLEAEAQLSVGNPLRSRELLGTALENCPIVQASPLPEEWTPELCQAMGEARRSDQAEEFVANLSGPGDRARHLAALSLGCSLAGCDDEGTRHAHAAARLMSDVADPGLANAVAQALAYAGDEPAACAMVQASKASQRQHALTAVAAGLVRHCPEGAARVARPLVETFARRLDTAVGRGSPRIPLIELASLLLAFPDVRDPDPQLSDALHLAALRVADPSRPRSTRSMAVLTLLARLGCLPGEATYAVENPTSTEGWGHSAQRGQQEAPSAELALLAAMDGDTAAALGHAEAARRLDARSMALRTTAAHLAGIQVPLATDSDADDRVVRTCLALARASREGSPQEEATARRIAVRLLRSDAWTCTIPLLPTLAPGALGHLRAIASDASRHEEHVAAEDV